MKITADQEKLQQDILSGKYRDYYLEYGRKSSDDTDNQKNSISYQKSENTRFALREGLPIASITVTGFCTDGIISERHSGFKENVKLTFGANNMVQYRVDRPKFYQLVQLLNKGCFKGVIFLCWDRASRNKGDDTIIRKLMKAGIDVRFTLANYDKTSSGELHMDVDGMFAAHHSRVTSEKVKLTFRESRDNGLWTNRAPVGYLNIGSMGEKPLDPVRAPIIKQLFEKAATGEWSLVDLARWATEQGFTMQPMRRRRTEDEILAEEEDDVRLKIAAIERVPTDNSIHKILVNRFYTGRVPNNDGEWVPSNSHEAIVPDEVFNTVQEQLRKKNKGIHYIEVLDHPLRRIAYCGDCSRVYTPYEQKGIIYYGSRCKEGCTNTNKSINFDYIAGKVGELIHSLSFTKEELADIDARANTDIALLETKRFNQLEAGERRKKKIREDLAYLNANRLTLLRSGVYTPELLAAEDAKLNLELELLKNEEDASDVSMRETVKEIVKLSELLENVAVVYDLAKPQEKDRIIRIIFSELTLSGNTLQYKVKKGFEPLAARFTPTYDPIGWLSELLNYGESVAISIKELSTYADLVGTP